MTDVVDTVSMVEKKAGLGFCLFFMRLAAMIVTATHQAAEVLLKSSFDSQIHRQDGDYR